MPIYLDNNATTPIHPEVAAAMQECHGSGLANPASQHSAGRRARKILEEARDEIAEILGARTEGMSADRLIFTSGGTESNNLALRGLVTAVPGRVVVSAIEHPSVRGAADYLANAGFDIATLSVDARGVVLLDELSGLLTPATQLVSVMLANNETGVLQPVEQIARICQDRSVRVHTDAVQAVGKIPVHFQALGVDALTFSAHKFHGPVGIGGLLIRHGLQLQPMLFGGFQQAGFRPGTEPVALVVGMLKALQIWRAEGNERQRRMEELRDTLENLLRDGCPEMVVNGHNAARVPHTLNVAFPGLDRQAFVMALDMAGLACSSGSACASGSSEPSPVLQAMGLPSEVVESSIRLSLSAFTTTAEVTQAARCILGVINSLRHGNRAQRGSVPPRVRDAESI